VCDGRGFIALVPEAQLSPSRKRRPLRFRLDAKRVTRSGRSGIAKACGQIYHEEWRENLQGKLYWLAALAVGAGAGDRNDLAWLSENLDNHVRAIWEGRGAHQLCNPDVKLTPQTLRHWSSLPAEINGLLIALHVAVDAEMAP
jgi:hypothetical protein